MARESARDIILAHQAKLKQLNAAFGVGISDDPYRYIADDGTPFQNAALMAVHNKNITALSVAARTQEIERKRLYRTA